jgi:hypothetical protein
MDKLAILPLIGAFYFLSKKWDARDTFVIYFLPILTLVPAYYDTKLVSGIPEFSFWTSALIPVAFVWFINEKMEGYRFSWIDVIIILHIVFLFYAQFEATGYKDAQKIIFREILKRLVPFFILKAVMSDPQRRIKALITIVGLGAIVSIFMAYDFKFYRNFLDYPIRQLWPSSVPWDGVMSRYGFKRSAGAFAHPISAGYFFAMSTPIAFWLWRQRLFPSNRWGLIIFGLNALGVITSISRAPIAGLLLSFVIIWFGWSKSKSVSGGFLVILAIIGLSVTIPKFVEYVSIKRSHAKTQDQENAAYRKEMLDNYIEIIKERPHWGYGRYTFPIVKGQKSIDNEYLFIAITSGMNNLYVYLLLIVIIGYRLLRFSLSRSYDDPAGQLAWVLLGAWISAVFTQATVYSGMQTTHYFFMIAALAEALVINQGAFLPDANDRYTQPQDLEPNYAYHFSRAM